MHSQAILDSLDRRAGIDLCADEHRGICTTRLVVVNGQRMTDRQIALLERGLLYSPNEIMQRSCTFATPGNLRPATGSAPAETPERGTSTAGSSSD